MVNSCSPIVHLEKPDTAGVSPFSGADVSHGHVPLYVQQPGMPTPHMVCPGHVSSRDALLAQPGMPVRVGQGLAASLTRPGRRGTCSAGHSHGMQHCGEHGCEPYSANMASPPAYLYLVVTSRLMEINYEEYGWGMGWSLSSFLDHLPAKLVQ